MPLRPSAGLQSAWRRLGPGLITGAADDDPSGIATYSQAGAQFGYALTWTMFLTLPLMVAIQIISGCIGAQTRGGLARAVSHQMYRPVVYGLVGLLVAANTINIAADLAAMGEALRLVLGGSTPLYALAFGVGCLVAEIFIPYDRYAHYLKALTLVLLLYVATAFTVRIPWREVAFATFLPRISLDRDFLLMVVAVLGTTISPYLFFWQASQEAEEWRSVRRRRLTERPTTQAVKSRIVIDTWAGMLFSNLVAFFIIVTTAATLNASGVTRIETAAQAAEALRPIAGDLTFILFAAGIIGTGLLAVPVLAGSAAYGVADAIGMRGSLQLTLPHARGFYAIVTVATAVGAVLAVLEIDPIKLLLWTAVINGIVAVPIMLATMLVVTSPWGKSKIALPWGMASLGWLATLAMTAATMLFGLSTIGVI